VTLADGAEKHPILRGVQPMASSGSLYKNTPLASTATPLLLGSIPNQPAEPVAWTNQAGKSRVFYTSLGHLEDFQEPTFQRLLSNGILWALDKPVPQP
jgi:type 1 glutamine amidotransferase